MSCNRTDPGYRKKILVKPAFLIIVATSSYPLKFLSNFWAITGIDELNKIHYTPSPNSRRFSSEFVRIVKVSCVDYSNCKPIWTHRHERKWPKGET